MHFSIIGIFNSVSHPEKPDKRLLPEPTHSRREVENGVFALHRVFLLSCNPENESVDKLD
jgi:hypothetical protein